MTADPGPVAIIDYGLGNLFSVQQACRHVGLAAVVSSEPAVLDRAPALIVPGVGAFAHAMATLRARSLAPAIRRAVDDGRPVMGVCLGMQILLEDSQEFELTPGLGVVEGHVERLEGRLPDGRPSRVPHIGWTPVHEPTAGAWSGTLLDGIRDGTAMYFVHSYAARPATPNAVLATSPFGDARFCSALAKGNVSAFQFHPERSGTAGLRIYENLRQRVGRA